MLIIKIKPLSEEIRERRKFYKKFEDFIKNNPNIHFFLRTLNYENFIEITKKKLIKKKEGWGDFKKFLITKIGKINAEREYFIIFDKKININELEQLGIYEKVINEFRFYRSLEEDFVKIHDQYYFLEDFAEEYGKEIINIFDNKKILQEKEKHLQINKSYVQFIQVIGYPKYVKEEQLFKLLKKEGNLTISIRLEPSNKKESIDQYTGEINQLKEIIFRFLDKHEKPKEQILRLKELYSDLEDIKDKNNLMFKISILIMTKSQNLENLDKYTNQVQFTTDSLFISKRIFANLLQTYRDVLPNSNPKIRFKKNILSNATPHLYPFFLNFSKENIKPKNIEEIEQAKQKLERLNKLLEEV